MLKDLSPGGRNTSAAYAEAVVTHVKTVHPDFWSGAHRDGKKFQLYTEPINDRPSSQISTKRTFRKKISLYMPRPSLTASLLSMILLVGGIIAAVETYPPGFLQTVIGHSGSGSAPVARSSSLVVTIPSVSRDPVKNSQSVGRSTILGNSPGLSTRGQSNGQSEDFTLRASALHIEILHLGSSRGFYVYLESKNGFAGQISISSTVQLPNNRGSDPETSPRVDLSVDNPGTTMDKPVSVLVTVSTSQKTVQQVYEVIITGVNGELKHSTSIPVTVFNQTPAPRIAHSLSIDGRALFDMDMIGVSPGQTLSLESIVGPNGLDPYYGPVSYDATVTPTTGDITVQLPASFVIKSPWTYPVNSITIQAKPTTPPNTYTLTITVSGQGDAVTSLRLQLSVGNKTPSITLTSDTTRLTVPALGFTNFPYRITLHNLQGSVTFTATVTPSATGLDPSAGAASYAFSWNESHGFYAGVKTDADTPTGAYTLTITASQGQVSQSINIPLTVTPKEPSTVQLSTNSDHYTVKAGSSLEFDITMKSCGYRGIVDLTYAVSPANAGLTFTGGVGGLYELGNCSQNVWRNGIRADPSTPAGTYTLTIKASQTGASDTLTITVTVTS